MAITGYFSATNPDYPTPTLFVWVLYALLATALFFGFIYFRISTVKWEELDEFQKFQYGSVKSDSLTEEQRKEWLLINKKYTSWKNFTLNLQSFQLSKRTLQTIS